MAEEISRLENLKKMLQDDPQDTFARYALGLEYMSSGENENARDIFEELRVLDPNYVATYNHLGKIYELPGVELEAIKISENRVEVAFPRLRQ